MTQLVKAQLCEISGDDRGTEIGTPIDVQFNPTSLRVSISNRTAGGQQAGSQARQRPGTGEIQVSFDLVFDTADEGTTDAPVPVTRKTQIVEKFVRPRGSSPAQQTPPRVQFKWGSFLVQGVMESANIDLDLFAGDGTPLRAKVAVSIKGQDPSYRYDPLVPSSAAGAGGPPPGARDPAPGTPWTRGTNDTPAQLAQALPGESLQQLAARNGLDPNAWRALANGIANPLSLSAGVEVALPASLSLGGSGLTGAAAAGADPGKVAGQLPLVNRQGLPQQPAAAAARAPAGDGRADPVRAGQALTRQGGVTGAIERVRADAQRTAVSASLSAFGVAAPSDGAAAVSAASCVPRPYEMGIPVRAPRGAVGARVPVTPDPTTPGWQALQPRAGAPVRALDRKRPVDPCRCDCSPAVNRQRKG
jgi:contractile injection system tube protein